MKWKESIAKLFVSSQANPIQTPTCSLEPMATEFAGAPAMEAEINLANWSKPLKVTLLPSGQVCFKPPRADNTLTRRIFFSSLPKSGTYLLSGILSALGFDDTEIHGSESHFHDFRGLSAEEKLFRYLDNEWELPYAFQCALTMPGQYMASHTTAKCIRETHKSRKILFMIRDLRHTVVSHMRFRAKLETQSHFDSFDQEDLCKFLQTPPATFNLAMANEFLQIRHEVYPVRFEELATRDKNQMTNSLTSISEVTGFSANDVFAAVKQAFGVNRRTYTGNLSKLDGLWSPKAEELFVAMGGDVINEQMGYPRHIGPKA